MFTGVANNKGPITKNSDGSSKKAEIGGKSVQKANGQTSKKWFIVAIVVGSLVVIGVGGFGGIGLLQSHYGFSSLPQWLSSAIGTVGNTPQFWSLWTMTAGGALIGGGLIAFGAHKVRKAMLTNTKLEQHRIEQDRLEQDRLEQDRLALLEEQKLKERNLEQHRQEQEEALRQQHEKEAELAKQNVPRGLSNRFNNARAGLSMSRFDDNFEALGIKPDQFQNLSNSTYSRNQLGKIESVGENKKFIPEDRPDRYLIIIKTDEGELQCTKRLTLDEQTKLVNFLKSSHYEPAN
jgi:hypothetical protein